VDDAVLSVGTGEVLNIAIANFENSAGWRSRAVVIGADTIIDVFTEMWGVGVGRVTGLEAGCVATNEVVPFNHLCVSPVIAGTESLAVHETTHGVTAEIGTVRVHLTSVIISENVQSLLNDEALELGVGRSPDPLTTLNGALGNQARTVPLFRAPGDEKSFDVSDSVLLLARCPETEVGEIIEVESLAVGGLAVRSTRAVVVPNLGSANQIIRVDFFGELTIGEGLGGEGSGGECAGRTLILGGDEGHRK